MNTPILSDIKVLDNLLALNLNVNLWSARKKMALEDFGGAELPPEDLASLGSKRIADPNSLIGTASDSCPAGPSLKTRRETSSRNS
mgnify:CR=1 FL=1